MTFGEERVVVDYQEEESVNVMSVSLMHMDNGDIGMFYLVRKTYTIIQMYLRRSKDGGVTDGIHFILPAQIRPCKAPQNPGIQLQYPRLLKT